MTFKDELTRSERRESVTNEMEAKKLVRAGGAGTAMLADADARPVLSCMLGLRASGSAAMGAAMLGNH